MPIVQGRQYRAMQVLSAEQTKKLIESDFYVDGYACTFERYKLFTGETPEDDVYEKFEAGCFDSCDMSDVIMQHDHRGHVYARNKNGTLKLLVDEHGLRIGADLSRTAGAKDMYEEISVGLCDRMSFSFMPMEYDFDPETRTIIHKKIRKIYDISAVSMPANEGTEIHTRSFCDGLIAETLKEIEKREKNEILRKKLKLKMKMEGFI